jgi:hypothetical protein
VVDGTTERLAGTEEMLLADELLECARAHALRERGVAEAGCGGGDGRGVEEGHEDSC